MDENLHDIDRLFKDSIEAHEEMPSENLWNAIDNNLDKSNVIDIKRKYNNLRRLAVALLLLLLGTLVYEIQSKKPSKEVLAKNNAGSNKEINNNQREKTKQYNEEHTLNGSGSAPSATNMVKSGNTEMSTAGNDSLNNTVQHINKNTRQKTAEEVQQRAIVKVLNSKSKYEPAQNVANENMPEPQGSRSSIKKSSIHKTRITVINAAAEEMLTEKTGTEKNAIDKAAISGGSNELTALQKDKVEKITEELQKNNPVKINAERISPDAFLASASAKKRGLRNSKPFHFTVLPFYSPQFSFNRLEDDHHDPGPQPRNGREQIKNDEQHETASSLGVLVDIPIAKKWSLQSGITYLNKEIGIEPKKIFAKLDNDGKVKYRFDCSSGYTYISPKAGTTPAVGDSVSAAASTNTLKYIGIPLGLNYTFSVGKFSIIPGFGTAVNFLVKQRIETELIQGSSKEKQTINTIQGLKSTYFNAFTGIALEYKLNKRIALHIMPSGSFALSSINKDAAVKSYPNSFGVAGGIKIKF